jgi:hypothetical protein
MLRDPGTPAEIELLKKLLNIASPDNGVSIGPGMQLGLPPPHAQIEIQPLHKASKPQH